MVTNQVPVGKDRLDGPLANSTVEYILLKRVVNLAVMNALLAPILFITPQVQSFGGGFFFF